MQRKLLMYLFFYSHFKTCETQDGPVFAWTTLRTRDVFVAHSRDTFVCHIKFEKGETLTNLSSLSSTFSTFTLTFSLFFFWISGKGNSVCCYFFFFWLVCWFVLFHTFAHFQITQPGCIYPTQETVMQAQFTLNAQADLHSNLPANLLLASGVNTPV